MVQLSYDISGGTSRIPTYELFTQYDTGRTLQIDLFDGSSFFELAEGTAVTLNAVKPDRTLYSIAGELEDEEGGNTVLFTTDEQLTAVAGNVICELRITDGDESYSVGPFVLFIKPSATEGSVVSESVIASITTYIDTAASAAVLATESIEEVQALADAAAASATAAETAQGAAETAQAGAEEASEQAGTYATNAAESAAAAATSASEAASSAETAAASATAAETAQSAAETAQEAAGASETAAAEYASNALSYATSAATSEYNAASYATNAAGYAESAAAYLAALTEAIDGLVDYTNTGF